MRWAAADMRWVAAKKRSLFSLAALCALAWTLVAPAPALATRTFAGANGRLPAPTPDFDRALTQHAGPTGEHADRLPLYTTFDVVTLAFCSALEADQVEATVARQRYRLHLLSSQLARSDGLEWGRKTATGVSSWSGERNYKEWSHLERKTHRPSYQGLWTDPVTGIAYARNRWYDMRSASWLSEDPMGAVDSPNLYAFVGWGPQVGTDPMGLFEGAMVNVEVTNEAYMSGALPMPRITTTLEEQAVAQEESLDTVVEGAPVVILVGGVTAISGPVGLALAGGLLVDSSVNVGIDHYEEQLEINPYTADLSESILGYGLGRSTGLAEIVELSSGEDLDTGQLLTDLESARRSGRLGGITVLIVVGEGSYRATSLAKGAVLRPRALPRSAVPEVEPPTTEAPVVDRVTGGPLMSWNEWQSKYGGQGRFSRPKFQSPLYRTYKMTGIRARLASEATPRILVDPSVLQEGAALVESARIYRAGRGIYLPSDPSSVGLGVTLSEIVVWTGEVFKRTERGPIDVE